MTARFHCPLGCSVSYARERDLKRRHMAIVHPEIEDTNDKTTQTSANKPCLDASVSYMSPHSPTTEPSVSLSTRTPLNPPSPRRVLQASSHQAQPVSPPSPSYRSPPYRSHLITPAYENLPKSRESSAVDFSGDLSMLSASVSSRSPTMEIYERMPPLNNVLSAGDTDDIRAKLAQKSELLDLVTAELMCTKQKYRIEKRRRLILEAQMRSKNSL